MELTGSDLENIKKLLRGFWPVKTETLMAGWTFYTAPVSRTGDRLKA
jgi:hypothetical protein